MPLGGNGVKSSMVGLFKDQRLSEIGLDASRAVMALRNAAMRAVVDVGRQADRRCRVSGMVEAVGWSNQECNHWSGEDVMTPTRTSAFISARFSVDRARVRVHDGVRCSA